MCPGISYSTVHSLIFHTNGSVQDNKLFKEFCNRKQAHFAGYGPLIHIDNETLTLKDPTEQLKYDDTYSAITRYEVITTFMKIHNISATWVTGNYYEQSNSSFQFALGSYWCIEGLIFECCPPM